MEFSQPPPDPMAGPNFANPPPTTRILSYQGPQQQQKQHGFYHHRPYHHFNGFRGGPPMTQDDFDGKRLRKSVMRKTVDYNASIIKALETRTWQRDYRDRRALQPESIYLPEMLPPPSYMDNPINAVTTRFVKTATNKMRCPIFTLAWTPEGRRLVTGASSGEFTLWNGLTFNFETILQAHDVSVRTMVWSHNDNWMVTGDHSGFVKYWQSNMNNVKMFQAHKEPIRGIRYYCERCWCWRCCCYCRRRRPRCDRCGAASFLYHLTILLLVTIKYTIFILLMICAAPALRLVTAKIITDLQLHAGSFVLALVPNEKLLHNKSVPDFVPVPPGLFQSFKVGNFY